MAAALGTYDGVGGGDGRERSHAGYSRYSSAMPTRQPLDYDGAAPSTCGDVGGAARAGARFAPARSQPKRSQRKGRPALLHALCAAGGAAHAIGALALLLQHGGQLEATDARGDTPLHIAVAHGHTDLALALAAAGATLNAEQGGVTPLGRLPHAPITYSAAAAPLSGVAAAVEHDCCAADGPTPSRR